MPHVMVTADIADGPEQVVTLRERIGTADLESNHFAARLVERLAWAVSDAHEAEQGSPTDETQGQYGPLAKRPGPQGSC